MRIRTWWKCPRSLITWNRSRFVNDVCWMSIFTLLTIINDHNWTWSRYKRYYFRIDLIIISWILECVIYLRDSKWHTAFFLCIRTLLYTWKRVNGDRLTWICAYKMKKRFAFILGTESDVDVLTLHHAFPIFTKYVHYYWYFIFYISVYMLMEIFSPQWPRCGRVHSW